MSLNIESKALNTGQLSQWETRYLASMLIFPDFQAAHGCAWKL